jgi:hypothetical protein
MWNSLHITNRRLFRFSNFFGIDWDNSKAWNIETSQIFKGFPFITSKLTYETHVRIYLRSAYILAHSNVVILRTELSKIFSAIDSTFLLWPTVFMRDCWNSGEIESRLWTCHNLWYCQEHRKQWRSRATRQKATLYIPEDKTDQERTIREISR